MQLWEFSTADNPAFPDIVHNPYGGPAGVDSGIGVNGPMATVNGFPTWLDMYGTHQGVWGVTADGMDIYIPNRLEEDPCSWKDIWLQVTYSVPGEGNQLLVSSNPAGQWTRIPDLHQDLGGDMMYDVFVATLRPNPDAETIRIRPLICSLYVDQVVVDTQCIPEPASMSLVGLGSLLLLRRKRKA
jgi:hypothetical protein